MKKNQILLLMLSASLFGCSSTSEKSQPTASTSNTPSPKREEAIKQPVNIPGSTTAIASSNDSEEKISLEPWNDPPSASRLEKYDVNQNGVMDPDEIEAYKIRVLSMWDTNHDGKLDEAEAQLRLDVKKSKPTQ